VIKSVADVEAEHDRRGKPAADAPGEGRERKRSTALMRRLEGEETRVSIQIGTSLAFDIPLWALAAGFLGILATLAGIILLIAD